jgi:N-methylhydantoinase B
LAANVRIPVKVLGDLRAQLAACHIGERGLADVVARYGQEQVTESFTQLLDYTERLARLEIERLPDGRYEFVDYLDDDGIDPGPIRICAAVTVDGDTMDVDFAGSAEQVKGAINSVLSFTKSAVYACVRCLMPATIPNNEGYFRAIHVRAPAGSIVNPVLPASVAARGLTGYRIANAVMGALAQVAPDRIPACESGGDTGVSLGGYDAQRRPFVFLEFLVCSWGGRPLADGIDGAASIVVNFSNYPAEVIEREYPLRIEENGYLPDTGGPGRFRGGLALVRQYRFLEDSATLQLRADRGLVGPYGLAGGSAGAPARNFFLQAGEQRQLASKTTLTVQRGDGFRLELAGAGGWGAPLERDARAVLQDVLDQKVSVAHARQVYGVIIGANGRELDTEATHLLRAELER